MFLRRSCKAATRLMSLKLERRLMFSERLLLRLHLLVCAPCRQCDRQFTLMHQMSQHYVRRKIQPPRFEPDDDDNDLPH
ncbi:zf-HC2 domain-containing protein [Halomonas elongata]|uniref:anti-sigma factor family protein n=1 Tax=Halomonas elongata TaxID=2746 RepID=UPI0031B5C4E4